MANANGHAALVQVEHISKHFGTGEARVDALREVSLYVYPGQVVGLLGPSGSGKTTLLNLIGCVLEPTSGRLTLDGELVYQDHWLNPICAGSVLRRSASYFS